MCVRHNLTLQYLCHVSLLLEDLHHLQSLPSLLGLVAEGAGQLAPEETPADDGDALDVVRHLLQPKEVVDRAKGANLGAQPRVPRLSY